MSTDTEMPDRYRPDPWTDRAVWGGTRETPRATVPTLALREWLGVDVGDTLRFAPRDTRAVKFGLTVPDHLGTARVGAYHPNRYSRVKLPAQAIAYLGATIGETIRFERADTPGVVYARIVDETEGDA